jgi:hypothetical protein
MKYSLLAMRMRHLAVIHGPRGIDGFELADRVHTLRPGLAVLLMSGYPAGSALPSK